MRDKQMVQSERSEKGLEGLVKPLIGVDQNARIPLQREPCAAISLLHTACSCVGAYQS